MPTMREREVEALQRAIELDKLEEKKRWRRVQLQRKLDEDDDDRENEKTEHIKQMKKTQPVSYAWHSTNKGRR